MNILITKQKPQVSWLIVILVMLSHFFSACASATPVQSTANIKSLTTPTTFSPMLPPTEAVTASPTITPVNTTPTATIPLQSQGIITPTPPASGALQIVQLKMISENTGWAVDIEGKILRTTKGIQAWRNISPPLPDTNFGTTAFFADDNTAFVVFGQEVPLAGGLQAKLIPWRTTDGGQTWMEGETQSFEQHGPFFPIQLHFLNKERGWFMGAEFLGISQAMADLFETNDGGIHWNMIYRTIPEPQSEPGPLWAPISLPYGKNIFSFITSEVGFAESKSQLFITKDGGHTWQLHPLESPSGFPNLFASKDYITDDTPVPSISPPHFTSNQDGFLILRIYMRKQVEIPPGDIFHGIPLAQYLYYTHDGGQNWTPRPAPAKIGTIYFLNAKMGWFLGKNDESPLVPAQLYTTNNGGQNWTQISPESLLPLGAEIEFINEQLGFAFNPNINSYGQTPSDPYYELDVRDINPYLFYSEDGGRSWIQIDPPIN